MTASKGQYILSLGNTQVDRDSDNESCINTHLPDKKKGK